MKPKCKACGHPESEHDANARGVVPDPWCDCCFDFPFDTVNTEDGAAMKTETPRDAALRIATKYATPNTFGGLFEDVEAALNAERERAAKIAEDIMPIGSDDCYWCERVKRAAAAIRGSKD